MVNHTSDLPNVNINITLSAPSKRKCPKILYAFLVSLSTPAQYPIDSNLPYYTILTTERLRRRSAADRLLGLRVRIPPGACLAVSCECCVLSGTGLRVRPITRPGDCYRMCVACQCHCEASIMRPCPKGGLLRHGGGKNH